MRSIVRPGGKGEHVQARLTVYRDVPGSGTRVDEPVLTGAPSPAFILGVENAGTPYFIMQDRSGMLWIRRHQGQAYAVDAGSGQVTSEARIWADGSSLYVVEGGQLVSYTIDFAAVDAGATPNVTGRSVLRSLGPGGLCPDGAGGVVGALWDYNRAIVYHETNTRMRGFSPLMWSSYWDAQPWIVPGVDGGYALLFRSAHDGSWYGFHNDGSWTRALRRMYAADMARLDIHGLLKTHEGYKVYGTYRWLEGEMNPVGVVGYVTSKAIGFIQQIFFDASYAWHPFAMLVIGGTLYVSDFRTTMLFPVPYSLAWSTSSVESVLIPPEKIVSVTWAEQDLSGVLDVDLWHEPDLHNHQLLTWGNKAVMEVSFDGVNWQTFGIFVIDGRRVAYRNGQAITVLRLLYDSVWRASAMLPEYIEVQGTDADTDLFPHKRSKLYVLAAKGEDEYGLPSWEQDEENEELVSPADSGLHVLAAITPFAAYDNVYVAALWRHIVHSTPMCHMGIFLFGKDRKNFLGVEYNAVAGTIDLVQYRDGVPHVLFSASGTSYGWSPGGLCATWNGGRIKVWHIEGLGEPPGMDLGTPIIDTEWQRTWGNPMQGEATGDEAHVGFYVYREDTGEENVDEVRLRAFSAGTRPPYSVRDMILTAMAYAGIRPGDVEIRDKVVESSSPGDRLFL